jgi:hypothetical protein
MLLIIPNDVLCFVTTDSEIQEEKEIAEEVEEAEEEEIVEAYEEGELGDDEWYWDETPQSYDDDWYEDEYWVSQIRVFCGVFTACLECYSQQ